VCFSLDWSTHHGVALTQPPAMLLAPADKAGSFCHHSTYAVPGNPQQAGLPCGKNGAWEHGATNRPRCLPPTIPGSTPQPGQGIPDSRTLQYVYFCKPSFVPGNPQFRVQMCSGFWTIPSIRTEWHIRAGEVGWGVCDQQSSEIDTSKAAATHGMALCGC
jgi:hypothetical protein